MLEKWCRIQYAGRAAYAIPEGDRLRILDGDPFGVHRTTTACVALHDAVFLPPVQPANFHAAGLNYLEHIRWANGHHGLQLKVPTQADMGDRKPSALIGSGADVVLPSDSTGSFEFEGELVAVIGKTAKHLDEANALDCVAGYTLGNDLSERQWQFNDRTLWRAKSADTFKPMGPFVVSGLDPMDQEIAVRVNGRTASTYHTGGMIFSVAHQLARLSRYVTLHPGDVVWFGCDGPTLPGLKHGDRVEVVNRHIGVLSNRVTREGKVLDG